MQETTYTDTEMIVVAQARGPSIPRRTGNSKKLQQMNNPGPPVRKELQPGCNSTQNVSRFLFLVLSLGGGLAFVYNNTTITCIFESVGDGSSKVRSGSASMHSRTNQPRRPNEMFWYWNAPLGSKVPLVSKVLKSLLTSITWPIRHMRVRCALLKAQTSAWQPVNWSTPVRLTLTVSTTNIEVAHTAPRWS